MTRESIMDWLVTRLRELLELPPGPIDTQARLDDLGLDSLEAVGLTGELERFIGCRVDPTALWDHPSLDALATHLVELSSASASSSTSVDPATANRPASPSYTERTYDQFLHSQSREHAAAQRFSAWLDEMRADGVYSFEAPRTTAQGPKVTAVRDDGQQLSMRNFSSYNYLGFGTHPEVIAAAKDALDRYGLGAASSPVASGTLSVHRQLEHAIVDFLGVPDRAATLFSSGYGVNTGTLSAFVHQGHHVVLDRSAHVSLLEGAQLARADLHYFRHNDPDHLDRVLSRITDDGGDPRVLVCTEGLFSADGDRGRIAEISAVCRRHGAFLLVDEAHSILVAGDDGRGVAAEQGVLDQVDLLVLTFSKGLGGVGGALVARPEIIAYVNWYARCRMFSCALDPAVTGGVLQGFRLGASDEGHARRRRLHDNARYLRQRLSERLDVLPGDSWIVPVPFGDERLTVPLADHLQRRGLDVSIMQFPAVPKGESRVRLFVTAEHDRDDLDACVEVMCSAAERFGFAREEAPCATSS